MAEIENFRERNATLLTENRRIKSQLETEIQANGWLICDTPEEYLFTTKDDEKWDIALKVIGIDSGMLSTVGGSA